MSVVHVKRIAKTRSAVDYELYGARGSAKYRTHKANGTDRVAAMRCDLGSPEEFVLRAEALATKHGRKIEARSLIQSFENTEFDPQNPEHVQLVNDAGYTLAKTLHPNSDVLVISHVDGHGGHAHNHIKVLNHDNVTGKALQGNHLHWQVARVNDEIMQELGYRVAERGSRSKDQRSYWEVERDGASVTEFERRMGDRISEALDDPRALDVTTLRGVLEEFGIELVETKHRIKGSADGKTPERDSIGWTYKMRDETGEKPRVRRRKASSLSDEFTHSKVTEHLTSKQRQISATQKPASPFTGSARDDLMAKLAGVRDEMSDRAQRHLTAMEVDFQQRAADRAAQDASERGSDEPRAAAESVEDLISEVEVVPHDAREPEALVHDVSEEAGLELRADRDGEDLAVATALAEDTDAFATASVPERYTSKVVGRRGQTERSLELITAVAEREPGWVEALERGERLDETSIPKGIGPRFLEDQGENLHPAVREQLLAREAKKATARKLYEEITEIDDDREKLGAAPEQWKDSQWASFAKSETMRIQAEVRTQRRERLTQEIAEGDYAPNLPASEAEARSQSRSLAKVSARAEEMEQSFYRDHPELRDAKPDTARSRMIAARKAERETREEDRGLEL